MIQKDTKNTLHHTWDANKSKYNDDERSLGTLVTKTHDFLEFFLTKGPYYPHAFLKKRWGYCNRLRLSVRPSVRLSVTLSPPKPFDEIQPNLVCELLT